MPIITPAYPSMCATHNISMSTKTVLLRELQRGGDIVDKIFAKQLSWNDLFARHSFFTQDYKYYLSITASSKTKEAESVWSGLVESKLRHLVGALDRKPIIAVAHPFPKGFERVHLVTNDQAMEAVKNGSTQYQAVGTKTEMTDETKNAAHEAAARSGVENAEPPELAEQKKPENDGQTVYTTTYYIGLELKPLEPGTIPARVLSAATNLARCLPVSGYLDRFTNFQVDVHIVAWVPARGHGPSCHPRSQVRHQILQVASLSLTTCSFDLPEDVFQPGETRPQRPKKKAVKRTETAGQKRRIGELDVSVQKRAR